jgi:glycosyltransferase involved in cell wall biosynthesis
MAGARHGGAEAFFTRLAVALERAGQAQRVAIRHSADRAAALRAGGVEVAELPFGGKLDFRTRPALKRLMRDWQPDVVLTWMNRATAAMPAGSYVHVGRLGGYYDLKYYRFCDHLIGNTRDIVAYLVKNGWPAERAHYLPNFPDAVSAPPVRRETLGTPADATLLLALGRLHPTKGFDVLLHALTRLPGVHLWLAGEGAERSVFEQLVIELGLSERVRLLGWRDDTAALLAAADILVCPSRHEPLGNVVLEAWAHRVPVVATASEGPRGLIKPGETGLLVPVEDADALAHAVAQLIGDTISRTALVDAGHAAYSADFSEPAVISAYSAFIQRVAV